MKFKKKILKNLFIQNFLGFLTALYIFFVKYTSKITHENISVPEKFWNNNKPFILAFWHGQLMMIGFAWKFKDSINILASGHSDGRFGSIVGKYFKLNNIESSNKKKNISLMPIFKLLKNNQYIGITPDGPRGPKEEISEGIIKIAKSSNVPILPIGFWSSKNIKLNSWDSFLVTLPFSKCSFVWSDPIEVPIDINDSEIPFFQNKLKEKININVEKAKNNCK